MADVPRPPYPPTLGERFWARLAEEREAIAERRLPPDPSPGGRRSAGVPPLRIGGTPALLATMVAAMALVGGIAVVGAWGWQLWSSRAAVAVEDQIPRAVAPPVPTFEPARPLAAAGPEGAAAPTSTSAPQSLLVHVAGSVRQPGVVEVASTARVIDALKSAGGPTDDADLDRINLAAPLQDGQHVYVIATGETAVPVLSSGPTGGSADSSAGVRDDGPVNINVASLAELERLPGVGPATASSIVEFRNKRGPFFEPADLLNVPGIGPAKFAAMESLVAVGAVAGGVPGS